MVRVLIFASRFFSASASFCSLNINSHIHSIAILFARLDFSLFHLVHSFPCLYFSVEVFSSFVAAFLFFIVLFLITVSFFKQFDEHKTTT